MAEKTITNLRGPAARITFVDATSVPADQPATVKMTGPDQNRAFEFEIPRGLPTPDAIENDAAVAAYVNAPDSATGTAIREATVGKGELVIFAGDYGDLGNGMVGGVDATVPIQAAIDAAYAKTGVDQGQGLGAIRGATVQFPPGAFRTTAPLKMKPYVTLRGSGMQTSQIFNDTTDLFRQDVGDLAVTVASFENIWLRTGTSGGHLFNILAGGYYNCSWFKVQMSTGNPTSSIWKQYTGSFLDNSIDVCRMYTSGQRTVPAWDITLGSNTCNSNQWTKSWCHGRGTTLAPFFRIESTNAWHYNNTFRDLVGEQNGGGFIHLYSVDGVVIENSPDWDLVGAYQADVIRVTYGAFGATRSPRNVRIESSFRLANGGLAAGVYDVNAPSIANRNVRISGAEVNGGIQLQFNLSGDASVVGHSQGYRVLGAADVLNGTHPTDEVATGGSNSTVTLPTTAVFGREFRFNNIGSGVLTIIGTVDGVVNPTLARWGKMHVRFNGVSTWFTV